MKLLKKIFVGVIGASIVAMLKIFLTVFSFVCRALAYLILYFGLEFLFLYLIASSFLFMYGAISVDITSLNFQIFLFGLFIALACSILLTIKHIAYNPLTRYLKVKLAIKEKIKKEHDLKMVENNKEKLEENIIGKTKIIDRYPIVYRSKNNSDIVIFEYENFYHVYRTNNLGQLTKIDEKPKIAVETAKVKTSSKEGSVFA